jgi:triosephosphate isomerase
MDKARQPLVVGNWKMNAGGSDGCELAAAVARMVAELDGVQVVVAPPFTALAAVAHQLHEAPSGVELAAQNMHAEPAGAFTGEVSAAMIKVTGASWVILGHSERRQLFGETCDTVARKVIAALAAGLRPIACVGETLAEREAGETLEVVGRQVRAFARDLAAHPGVGVVAYEPVWAIGTGRVAQPEDAQAVQAAIRGWLREEGGSELGRDTRILYGGSVAPNNAEGLFAQPDVDGGLVGGASLKAESFGKIVEIAAKLAKG